MTLSAALDSGLAFGVVVVFFGILYPGWTWLGSLQWWGTRVYKEVRSQNIRHAAPSSKLMLWEIGMRLEGLSLSNTCAR